MPLVPAKCPQCGGNLEVNPIAEAAVCKFCGTPFVVEKAINNYNINNTINAQNVTIQDSQSLENLIQSGETFLSFEDYPSAEATFSKVTKTFPYDYRGWYGLIKTFTLNFSNVNITKPIYKDIITWQNKMNSVIQNESKKVEINNIVNTYLQSVQENFNKKSCELQKKKAELLSQQEKEVQTLNNSIQTENSIYTKKIVILSVIEVVSFFTLLIGLITLCTGSAIGGLIFILCSVIACIVLDRINKVKNTRKNSMVDYESRMREQTNRYSNEISVIDSLINDATLDK